MPQAALPGAYCMIWNRAGLRREGLAMRLAAKGLTAILSIITIGAALSLPISPAFAGDDGNSKNVTEDEIVRALGTVYASPLVAGSARVCCRETRTEREGFRQGLRAS